MVATITAFLTLSYIRHGEDGDYLTTVEREEANIEEVVGVEASQTIDLDVVSGGLGGHEKTSRAEFLDGAKAVRGFETDGMKSSMNG